MSQLTIAPLSSRILQRLPGARAIHSFATESTVVCEAEEQPMRPAVYPSGELDRITGVHEFSAGLRDEVHLTTRDRVHHTETIAWRLRNVYLAGGRLCNHRSYKRLNFGALPLLPGQTEPIEETAALCSSDAGNDYFAHFLLDDTTTALLGRDFGQVTFGGFRHPRTPHMRDYLEQFGISYRETNRAQFRDLWIFTDHSQNSHRRGRLQQLSNLLRKKFAGNSAQPPVYIRRGTSGTQRILENEPEIEALLAARGFQIVDPLEMTADELCRQLNNSPLVAGVEGSQLVHGLLNLRQGGALFCIQPAARFNAVFRGFCNSLDLDWGFVVAEGNANSFRLSTKRLLRTIDRMLDGMNSSC